MAIIYTIYRREMDRHGVEGYRACAKLVSREPIDRFHTDFVRVRLPSIPATRLYSADEFDPNSVDDLTITLDKRTLYLRGFPHRTILTVPDDWEIPSHPDIEPILGGEVIG